MLRARLFAAAVAVSFGTAFEHRSGCDFGYVYLDFDGNAYRPAGCDNEIDDATVHYVISPCPAGIVSPGGYIRSG